MRRKASAEVEQVHQARTRVRAVRAPRRCAIAVLIACAVLGMTASRSAASSPFKPPPKHRGARTAPAARLPAPAADAATVERVRYVADEQSTRVVVMLSRSVPYEVTVLPGERSRGSERRVVLDFSNATLGAEAQAPIGVEDGLLKRIRTGQFTARTARVVLDLASVTGHHVEALDDPPRIVVDIAGKPTGSAASARDADHAASRDTPAAAPSPPAESARVPDGGHKHDAGVVDNSRPRERGHAEKSLETARAAEPADSGRAPENTGGDVEASRRSDKPRETTHGTNGERSRSAAAMKGAPRAAVRAEETASVSTPPPAAPESAPPDARAAGHGREESPHEVSASVEPPQPPRVPPVRSTPWRIVLDPGHGGGDPGTHGVDGVAEKDVTLAIAKRLKRRLEEGLGAQVLLTRDRDATRSLAQRTAFANASNADVFVSIHANADASGELHGIETYTLNNTDDRAAIRLAKMENGPGVRTGRGDLSFILSDMVQSGKEEESIALANRLQQRLVSRLRGRYPDVRSLGVKKGPFYVLVGAYMPCVLVETSFLSHPVEGRRLVSGEYQSEIVEGLYLGMAEFLGDQRLAKTL